MRRPGRRAAHSRARPSTPSRARAARRRRAPARARRGGAGRRPRARARSRCMGARRIGSPSSVRTSPTSMQSFAIVLSGNASGTTVRLMSVMKRGASPRCSALPSVRRNGVAAKRRGSRRGPLTGHSNSRRALNPPAEAPPIAGPFTVWIHCRPSRRSRNATPAAASAPSGVSKYVEVSCEARTRARLYGFSAGCRAIAAAASGAIRSLSSVSVATAHGGRCRPRRSA